MIAEIGDVAFEPDLLPQHPHHIFRQPWIDVGPPLLPPGPHHVVGGLEGAGGVVGDLVAPLRVGGWKWENIGSPI